MSNQFENQPVTPNGKVAIVTGANSGIGRATAIELALQGYHVFLACRDQKKTEPVLIEIRFRSAGTAIAEYLPLDLADLSSVKACAQTFLARGLPLHLLVNNAGLAGAKGITTSGFELAFGVTHVGHFLLTKLLLDTLKGSAPARVVTVSSRAHLRVKQIDYATLHCPASGLALKAYAQAKLANLLFSIELAQRLNGSGVAAYAVHPGVVSTNVWRSVPGFIQSWIRRYMRTPIEGAATTLYCANHPTLQLQNGFYYDDCKKAPYNPIADDSKVRGDLWMQSEGWVSAYQ